MYGKEITFNSLFSDSSPSLLCMASLDGNQRDLCRKFSVILPLKTLPCLPIVLKINKKFIFTDIKVSCGLDSTNFTYSLSLQCSLLPTLAFSCSLLFAGVPQTLIQGLCSGVCSARGTSFLFQPSHSFSLTLVCVIIV